MLLYNIFMLPRPSHLSPLTASAFQRLGIAALILAVLWGLVFWASA